MSKITTRSLFYYGHTITTANFALDFNEGGPELKANLNIGDYTLTEFKAEVQRALREAGAQNYTVSLNRTTRKLTITAPSAFTVLPATGSRSGASGWGLVGFSADTTGTSITGTGASGNAYETQYPVDKYTSIPHSPFKESAAVQTSASGVTQVIYFGDGARPKMNIRLISDQVINQTNYLVKAGFGVSDALQFLNYLITKAKVEFMPNAADPSVFDKVYLESCADSSTGTALRLKNMKTPEFYETGDLTFRKVLT